jgi:hypothetical protein
LRLRFFTVFKLTHYRRFRNLLDKLERDARAFAPGFALAVKNTLRNRSVEKAINKMLLPKYDDSMDSNHTEARRARIAVEMIDRAGRLREYLRRRDTEGAAMAAAELWCFWAHFDFALFVPLAEKRWNSIDAQREAMLGKVSPETKKRMDREVQAVLAVSRELIEKKIIRAPAEDDDEDTKKKRHGALAFELQARGSYTKIKKESLVRKLNRWEKDGRFSANLATTP